ncbi:hypothetical protein BRD14_01265 [Halobacteriales archaeon SW_5_68_122]|nr:MAG: hypothetical protein BRD14_01265 [Halobacteriales archaeon SW_5_68_122]
MDSVPNPYRRSGPKVSPSASDHDGSGPPARRTLHAGHGHRRGEHGDIAQVSAMAGHGVRLNDVDAGRIEAGIEACVVRDSRLRLIAVGVALGLEAIQMVESGVAGVEDVDTAMEVGYGHPMGPPLLTGHVGLESASTSPSTFARNLGERFRPPQREDGEAVRPADGWAAGVGA